MNIDLSGRVALVTGASRGIGRATALALASAGATVAVHFHRREGAAVAVAEAAGRGARPFRTDLANVTACDTLFDEVVAAYGRLDVLVNNAGVAIDAPLSASTEEWLRAWEATLHVNLRAVELLCRRAIELFGEADGGRIINVASRAAFRGDLPGYMAYAASKGGVVALTRSIARTCGKDGIRAFVVAPGFTRTDMAQEFIDAYGEEHAASGIALDRLTEPEDVAPTIVFLASGNADHATGSTIDINAGSYVH